MTIQLGQIAPDFRQDSSIGPISLHDYLGTSWGVLFSHPRDFTPVCTTELAAVSSPEAGMGEAEREAYRPLGRQHREPRGLGARHRGDAGAGPRTSR